MDINLDDYERWYEEDLIDVHICPKCGRRMTLSLEELFCVYVCNYCGYETVDYPQY